MNYMKKIAVVMAMMIATAIAATAQDYRFDAGGGVGISGYLGDANQGNVFAHSSYAAGGVFRYVINSRMAVKASATMAHISGDSADEDNVYPAGETYAFKSDLYDLGAQFEFNFLNFGIGSKYLKLSRITPYLTLGLSGTYVSNERKNTFTVCIPMGVGVKYKVKERLNLGLEFTMRKSLSDNLDGLSDLNGIEHGFGKNTDWYMTTMVTVTYEFGRRCKTCHYVD